MDKPQFNKALIVPIVMYGALVAKQVFHYNVGEDFINGTVDFILAVGGLAGLFMNRHKK